MRLVLFLLLPGYIFRLWPLFVEKNVLIFATFLDTATVMHDQKSRDINGSLWNVQNKDRQVFSNVHWDLREIGTFPKPRSERSLRRNVDLEGNILEMV
jgi:hypothetical protein